MLIGLWVAAKLGHERGQRDALSLVAPPPRREAQRRLGPPMRGRRPWLGLVGVALATQAALLAGVWWLVPALAVCAWWWCPTEWRWTWLLPLACGVVGTGWAIVGVGLLDVLPNGVGAVVWIGSTLLLAGVGHLARAKLAALRGMP